MANIMESVILPSETDIFVETMHSFNLEDIGSKHWFEWHSRISKLSQQAILEASELREEYVKEALIIFGKIPILVQEAITIYIWKKKVLPLFLKFEQNLSHTFAIYSVLYHEAICVSLLEIVLFHSNSCETLEDIALDLLDYCCEAATQLLGYHHINPTTNENAYQEILRQQADIQFDIGIRSISIIRYFAEYLDKLPVSIASRMYTVLDVPSLLVELITTKPWIRTNEQKNTFKYINGKWQKIEGNKEINGKLHQIDAQIWIGLRQLLLDANFLTHYNLTDFHKTQLLKLQKYLHDTLLDQLSPLIDLKQWLCQLAMSNLPNPPNKPILIEVLPQVKENIINCYRNKWQQIAKKQIDLFLKQNHDNLVEMAQSLSEAYNVDVIEKLEQVHMNNCGACGCNAVKKCSRCKSEYYCSRNCQVKHWPQHREICDITVGKNNY